MEVASENIRFEVSVNGEVVATSGIDGYGVLTTGLTWVLHDPEEVPEHVESASAIDRTEWLKEVLDLRVGGLDSIGHLLWAERFLSVGDEIRTRVLPPGPVDEAELVREGNPLPSDD